jgi:uncharacterized protein YrrD
MKASELKGRAVISLADAQKVGEVDNVLVDCSQNQVVGFRVKHGLFSSAQVLRAQDVRSVGPDAITIANRELLVDRESAADLHPIPDLNALSGINVVSESGTLVGALDDVDVDPSNLAVTAYYLGGSLWEHLTQGNKHFPSTPGLRFGGKLLIIPDTLAGVLSEARAVATTDTPPATSAGAATDFSAAPPAPTPTPVADTSSDFSTAPDLSNAGSSGTGGVPPAVTDAAPTPYPAPLDTTLTVTPADDPDSSGETKARSAEGTV